MNIGIIGAGNIGGAIAKGLAKAGCLAQEDICLSDVNQNSLDNFSKDFPQAVTCSDNQRAAGADIVLVAVKPWLVEKVLNEIGRRLNSQQQILIVVAAGVSFEQIYSYLPASCADMPCYRLIPNTAIAVRESMSMFSAANTTPAQDESVLGMFRQLGAVMLIPEDKMAAATSLTSCGIAYALRFIRASVEAAVEMGFYPSEANAMLAQTVKGAAALLLNNQSTAEDEIDKVTTPGGITIRGLNEMEANGFTNSVIKGLKASL